jgi:hypothetical protein
MKKLLIATSFACIGFTSFAQTAAPKVTTSVAPPAVPVNLDAVLKFEKTEHDFGNVPEGPQATTSFKVKNISKEPITIDHVQASCGCTVPNWTKEPILPGKTGTIDAVYNTSGRPGVIHKTLDVRTSKGNKTLTIKGNVESGAAKVVEHDHNAPGHVPHDAPPGFVPPPPYPNPADINMPPVPGGTIGMPVMPPTPPAPKM